MATRAKLHGKPLQLARQIQQMYGKPREPHESRRAWGKRLGAMIHELATQSNVEPSNFAEYIPDHLVKAIARERTKAKLTACRVNVAPSPNARDASVTPLRGKRRSSAQFAVAA